MYISVNMITCTLSDDDPFTAAYVHSQRVLKASTEDMLYIRHNIMRVVQHDRIWRKQVKNTTNDLQRPNDKKIFHTCMHARAHTAVH